MGPESPRPGRASSTRGVAHITVGAAILLHNCFLFPFLFNHCSYLCFCEILLGSIYSIYSIYPSYFVLGSFYSHRVGAAIPSREASLSPCFFYLYNQLLILSPNLFFFRTHYQFLFFLIWVFIVFLIFNSCFHLVQTADCILGQCFFFIFVYIYFFGFFSFLISHLVGTADCISSKWATSKSTLVQLNKLRA